MEQIITIGLDIAKNVFQVHGIDESGKVAVRRQLKRRRVLVFFAKLPSYLVGMEACATSHYWAREIEKLGHEVRMMPPRYVKPYVKRNKNDAADAEAICEAVTRPTMRFVPIKTPEQQSVLMLHRTRQLFVRQRMTLINAIRARSHEADRRLKAHLTPWLLVLFHRLMARPESSISDVSPSSSPKTRNGRSGRASR